MMVTVNGGGSITKKVVQLDRDLARRYIQGLKELQRECQLSGTIDVNAVAGYRDLFSVNEETAPIKDLSKVVAGLTQKALGDLEKMRKKEGAVLQKDLTQRLHVSEGRLRTVQQTYSSVVESLWCAFEGAGREIVRRTIGEYGSGGPRNCDAN